MEAYRENAVLQSSVWPDLTRFLRTQDPAWPQAMPDFEQFAPELPAHLQAVERELLASELARSDIVSEQVMVQGFIHCQSKD